MADPAAVLGEIRARQAEIVRRWERSARQVETTIREFDGEGRPIRTTSDLREEVQVRGEPMHRVLARDGRPLTAVEREKEEQRLRSRLERREAAGRRRTESSGGSWNDFDLSSLLAAVEIREERPGDGRAGGPRSFAFRPRPGFEPRDRREEIANRLVGRIDVDPDSLEVVRAEGRLESPYRVALGLGASIRRFEVEVVQEKDASGVRRPRSIRVRIAGRFLLVNGFDLEIEQRFDAAAPEPDHLAGLRSEREAPVSAPQG